MGKSKRKIILWIIMSVFIGGISIYAVLGQTKEISFSSIFSTLMTVNKIWIVAALICMLGFIYFEACAIRQSCSVLEVDCSVVKCVTYSAADIYFSAITPSATGGQPASACAMVQDGISVMKTTAALIMNLAMYTVSLIVIGGMCLLTRPKLFLYFGNISRMLIITGVGVQLVLASFFILLIKNVRILSFLGEKTIHILKILHLIKNEDHSIEKFRSMMEQYKMCAELFFTRKREIRKILFFNILQRISQIAVTMCVYIALGGGLLSGYDLLAMQSFVVLGSNYVPIPGGMGITDYLMLDGFKGFLTADRAVKLELIARSLSFYFCIIICGLIFLLRIGVIALKRKVKK